MSHGIPHRSDLLIVGYRGQIAAELQLFAFGFVILIAAAVEIVKHFVNRSRVEILKELKSLECQVLDLKSKVTEVPPASRSPQ